MDIESLYSKYLECQGQISIDSRKINPNAMFFAIKGERFDGNAFVDEVIAKGAKYAVVDDPKAYRDERTIVVQNSLKTLQQLANRHRNSFDIPVLAITGSNGKTTTKELINTVLSSKYKVHATSGNFNNHIGVPLTLLSAQPDTEILIVEMGANSIGEIADLCIIADPEYGLITNIGQAHLEGFGSLDGVVTAKTELYKHIVKRDGLIFYNPLDPTLIQNLPDGARAVPYRKDLEFRESQLMVELKYLSDSAHSPTQLIGTYNYPNISAGMSIGQFFGVGEEEMKTAVCDYMPTNNRSQLINKGDVTLILDAYNANPSSMKRSIESLAKNTAAKDKVLLLGDMKELGDYSTDLHAEVLEFLQSYEWKAVILVGKEFALADATKRYLHYENFQALSKSKDQILTMLKNSICLVKASRSLRLEQVEDLLD